MLKLFKKAAVVKINYASVCDYCQIEFQSETREAVCPSCGHRSIDVYPFYHFLPHGPVSENFMCQVCRIRIESSKEKEACPNCNQPLESYGRTWRCGKRSILDWLKHFFV